MLVVSAILMLLYQLSGLRVAHESSERASQRASEQQAGWESAFRRSDGGYTLSSKAGQRTMPVILTGGIDTTAAAVVALSRLAKMPCEAVREAVREAMRTARHGRAGKNTASQARPSPLSSPPRLQRSS